MIKITTLLLMSLSLSHADFVPGARQGYGSPYPTNPMAAQKAPPLPTRPVSPALPPRPAAQAQPQQGILVGDLKAKFKNLRNLISATEGLLHETNLVPKYGNNLHMVSTELDKLENAVGDGRSLASIHDQEVIANSTFGKNKFDQEKYNNLLGIAKQTAMSACTEGGQQHKTNSRSGVAGQHLNDYINTCNNLKGTQDVAMFVKMVDKLADHSEKLSNTAMPAGPVMTNNSLDAANVMLKNLYVLAKSKLLSKQQNMSGPMKTLISQYKALDKLNRSKKGPGRNLGGEINTLIDQIHSTSTQVCQAIAQNIPALLQRMSKGKKAAMIQTKTNQALTDFNNSCTQFTQYHTTKDMTMVLTQMVSQEKALVAALKGK